MRKNQKGFTLIELMIVIAIIAIIAAIAIPGLLSSQRASNERNASTSLKTIASAQADLRANDRDGNRVNDFWTADVAALFTIAPVADQPIKLIELSIAGADCNPVGAVAIGAVGVGAVTAYTVRSAKAGYWYQSLVVDASTEPDTTYNSTTGGTPDYGATQNTSMFGVSCLPDTLSAGKFGFVLNEGNTVYRVPLSTQPKAAGVPAARINTYGLDTFPNDTVLKASWNKLD